MLTTFTLVREGTSDEGLVPHLRELLVRAGLDEVIGSVRDYSGPITERLLSLAAEARMVDIAFVHWDADKRVDRDRRAHIAAAVAATPALTSIVVPVIPIQELEAWLLLDEAAIRTVVGKPSCRVPLGLPRLKRVEETASPKEVLQGALLAASETTGRRRRDERRAFSTRRRTLLERLDIDGPVRQLTAWQRLEADVASAVSELLARRAQP